MKSRIKFLPLLFVEVYLVFSLVLMSFGPLQFNLHNRIQFIFLIIGYHLAFVLGYFFGVYNYSPSRTNIYKGNDVSVRKRYSFLLIIVFYVWIIVSRNMTHASSYIPIDVFRRAISGIFDPVSNYNYNKGTDALTLFHGNKAMTGSVLLIYFLYYCFPAIMVIWWRTISLIQKILSVAMIFLCVLLGFATGTNAMIFHIIIPFSCGLIIRSFTRSQNEIDEMARRSMNQNKKIKNTKRIVLIAKAIDLILETVFYGLFWSVAVIVFVGDVSIQEIISGTFAVFTGKNWFAFAYILLYLFHPFVNRIIEKLSQLELKKITIILTVIISGLKTIYHGVPICDFLFMINIYFIICYIERSGVKKLILNNRKKGIILITSGLFIVHIILVLAGDYYNSIFLHKHSYYLNLRGSIFILIDSLFVFYSIAQIEPHRSKIVNLIASTTFGVFLSHQLIGYKFWFWLLYKENMSQFQSCFHMLISVLIIFIGCSVIDLARQLTIGKLFERLCSIQIIKSKMDSIDLYINS